MSKVKTSRGYYFVKELGGAARRQHVSFAAQWLTERRLIQGRVLDYGCGHGYDADHFGWTGFDPYYRQIEVTGCFDTILCNHVLNMLTRASRHDVLATIKSLLAPAGNAWLIVPRDLPIEGRVGLRRRIQNHVVFTLPTVLESSQVAIYSLQSLSQFDDVTREFEHRLR